MQALYFKKCKIKLWKFSINFYGLFSKQRWYLHIELWLCKIENYWSFFFLAYIVPSLSTFTLQCLSWYVLIHIHSPPIKKTTTLIVLFLFSASIGFLQEIITLYLISNVWMQCSVLCTLMFDQNQSDWALVVPCN